MTFDRQRRETSVFEHINKARQRVRVSIHVIFHWNPGISLTRFERAKIALVAAWRVMEFASGNGDAEGAAKWKERVEHLRTTTGKW